MLTARNKQSRQNIGRGLGQRVATQRTAQPGRPGARGATAQTTAAVGQSVSKRGRSSMMHPLTDGYGNNRLHEYETGVKSAFDNIVPTLKQLVVMQYDTDFVGRAQQFAQQQLGYELPVTILEDAWVDKLDMRRLFAWCLFETYKRFCDEFFTSDPLSSNMGSNVGENGEESFQAFLQSCGFHTLDVSPCADGRLAHVIRYVLRLPYRAVRRKSYAGAMFDIEDSMDKWVETELLRFRQGQPNTADEATRYLKTVVYHYSSVDPEHEGCAAHGSDTAKAAQAGLERLKAFQQAVENTHCCGASIDHLLIGLDTDTDAIRIHVPASDGEVSLDTFIDAREIYAATKTMSENAAQEWISDYVAGSSSNLSEGMIRFMSYLLKNNISQIDYVRHYHGEYYADAGHAERFIGAGIGFEEVQLRNLTYFAYLNTVEEATADLDVGIKIFTGLNVSHGLPVPVVVRYDYHGNVPGARDRAVTHCHRVAEAIKTRYSGLAEQGLLHTLLAVRDVNAANRIEVLECSVNAQTQEAH